MRRPIIDLHCDLLFYLEEKPERTARHREVHCSIPQLHEGSVKLQILALFTRTGVDSVRKGTQQAEIYKNLPFLYPQDFCCCQVREDFIHSEKISILPAIENASGFWDEQEPFEVGLKRLKFWIQTIGSPLYISLTWNMENRFGGGNATKVGLKEDGKRLLDELHQQNIAIDFSHTSDALADGILNYIESNHLSIPVLASHSNARRIADHPRNLPDPIAKEIFRRGGVIGLNFYHLFVGQSEEGFIRHIDHWLQMGGEKQICFGADFFYEGDAQAILPNGPKLPYFEEYQNAGCYERLLGLLQKELKLPESILEGLAYKNAENFLIEKFGHGVNF